MKRYQYYIPIQVVDHVQRSRLEDPRRGRALPSLESAYCRMLQDAIQDYCEGMGLQARIFVVEERNKAQFQNARLALSPELHASIKRAAQVAGVRMYDLVSMLFIHGAQSFSYEQL